MDVFPDWLEIAFAGPRTIHEINVFSVQDNAIAPELPPSGPEPPVIPPVGDRLLAHGNDAKKVYDEARAQGITAPYLERVLPKQEAFMGGWLG